MQRTTLLVLAVLLSAACGRGTVDVAGPDPSTGLDTPVTGGEPGQPVPDEQPSPVEPRPGMVDVRPVGWESARIVDDGRTVEVVWWSGVEPCHVLDHVEVEQGPDQVTITLFEGRDPAAGDDVACIEIAVQRSTQVSLAAPAGNRALVDGAEGEVASGGDGCGPQSTAPPCSQAEVGVAYPLRLYVHCGVHAAFLDGRWWRADPPLDDGSGNPPAGWGNPFDDGTVTLTAEDRAVFEAGSGDTAAFVPASAGWQPRPCA